MKSTTKRNPRVYMDVSIDGSPVERMIFELFSDVAPYTAENFRALCTGEKGISRRTGRPLHYKGSFFHHIVKGSMAQGGDFYKRDGTYGESIYGEEFPDELPSRLKHDERGLLSMAIADRETRGSLFTITFKALHHLDRKNIVFGKLVKGHEVLKKIENVHDGDEWTPPVTVKIINCGEYSEAKKESHKSKGGKEASLEDNSLESRKRGKHKKTSRDRRKKRRKYYSSESESSSDTETESSESDSDSDSSISSSSSSSDFSSSSDDRRKKRKRSSRRNKYKRGKRRDKRRDRKRRRRDKRAKHKSKRSYVSSESESSEDDGVADINGKGEHHKLPALINAELEAFAPGEAAASVPNQDGVDVEREEGEYPRENGEQLNNGVKLRTSAEESAARPDVLDDHPGKSRSRSITPKRATSKSMSISPRRSLSRSLSPRRSPSPNDDNIPGVRLKTASVSSGSISPVRGKRGRSASRSPTISPPPTRRSPSRSPRRTSSRKSSRKSVSMSPIRVARRSITRSPIRSAGRSISRSPIRSSLRSASRSPVRVVRRSVGRSPVRSSRRSISRSPIRSSRRSISRSPVRSSRKSMSRSSGRAPSRRSISLSPVRGPTRNNNLRSRSRSPVGSHGSFRERSLSRSRSPDESPKRIRRGRGFSDRYSYARRYRSPTPDRSPVRSYRYSRSDRDRYGRRSPPRRYRSPPRRRSPPRYRSRRSRSRSPVSRSPVRYRGRRYYSRSPVRSPSPVAARIERRRSLSHSSASRSSQDSLPPKRATYFSRSKSLSSSSSGSPPAKKGLVSYDDGTPDSGGR